METECPPVTVEGDWDPSQSKTVKNKLQLYFQSRKKSGGGESRVAVEDGAPRAAVYFKRQDVRDKVLAKENHEITLGNQSVRLRLSSAASPTNNSVSGSDKNTVFVSRGDTMAAAAAEKEDRKHRERKSSYEYLPPNMSELRLVLLGNSWSDRRDVGNLILGQTVFHTHKAPNCCLRVSGWCKWKEVVLINTPDLLHPHISQHKLTQHVENCVRLSDPGPHVFLLVLQPEDFTEGHRLRIQSILELFGDRSFDHSLVLISTPREESSRLGENFKEQPPLKHLIKMCRYRYLQQKDLELQELFVRLCQVVRENSGEHVRCNLSENEADGSHQNLNQKKRELTADYGLRIVLFGQSEEDKMMLGNFIMKKTSFHFDRLSPTKQCESVHGQWGGKPVTVVKAPDVFSLTVEAVRAEK